MKLEWDRPGVIRITAKMEEVALLIAGARMAQRALEQTPGEPSEDLARVLSGFDRAAQGLAAEPSNGDGRPEPVPPGFYHEGSRTLQERFGQTRLADRLEEVTVRPALDRGARAFIERADAFFLATADAAGRPTCSHKGGDPGFVRVLDDTTIAFPVYDGNGMHLSSGNIAVNPSIGMLFVDLERGHRLRVSGEASIVDDPAIVGLWPEAQMAVRVEVRAAFPNCPRYVHRYRLVERSRFVPRAGVDTPVPEWKQGSWVADVVEPERPAATR